MKCPSTYPILEVSSLSELVDASKSIEDESIIGVVFHDAFDPSALLPISDKLHSLTWAGNAELCSRSRRHTEEFSGHTWLPAINSSSEINKRDLRVLPLDIVKASISIHSLTAGTPINGPQLTFVQEFRSKKDANGLLHYDESPETSGLNMHITTFGEGILHLAKLKHSAAFDRKRRLFYEPDREHIQLMESPFYKIPIRAGSIAVFSAFGSQNPKRGKVLHKVETTSEFRTSATLDQVMPFNVTDLNTARELKRLRASGIDVDAYIAA